MPFGAAILMALFALCGFSAFLFTTTQYLQDVHGRAVPAPGRSAGRGAWLALGLGAGILVLALLSTGRRALGTATRAAALFEDLDRHR
ncbi:hypothetical protein [Microbispora sp. CA-102843]|uniref:hypothetical protein n=1 Tax=Microbispora sp. CA-102843 TaxID=3239952 RepID=UPI003D94A6AC